MIVPVVKTTKGFSDCCDGWMEDCDSAIICSKRSMTRQLRPFFVQELLKPLCTRGRHPYLPRRGGWTTRHACICTQERCTCKSHACKAYADLTRRHLLPHDTLSKCSSAITPHSKLWSGGLEPGFGCCAGTSECYAHIVAAPAVLRGCELPAGLPGHWWWRQFRGRRGRWYLHSRP